MSATVKIGIIEIIVEQLDRPSFAPAASVTIPTSLPAGTPKSQGVSCHGD